MRTRSVSYTHLLSKLQIDELKIDRIFLHTKSEVDNQRTKWILESIIDIAKKSQILVVVEGVESKQDDLCLLYTSVFIEMKMEIV